MSKKRIVSFISILLILISSFLIFYKHINKSITLIIDAKQIKKYVQNTSLNNDKRNMNSNYIAVLEIPKISLNKGLVYPTDKFNHVDYNIQIISGSNMPDIINGNLILASHNGNSKVSFFRNLTKLVVGDKIYVYYNGYKYEYILDNITEVIKNGEVEIVRDGNRNTITLITCKDNSEDLQLVYIGYMIKKEKY